MLTEFYWHPAHQVFTARALLYARRMAFLDKGSPRARWNQAYALAIAGLPAAALEELKAAKETAGNGAGRPGRPGWS